MNFYNARLMLPDEVCNLQLPAFREFHLLHFLEFKFNAKRQ